MKSEHRRRPTMAMPISMSPTMGSRFPISRSANNIAVKCSAINAPMQNSREMMMRFGAMQVVTKG